MFLLFKPKLIILCTLVSALVISGITYAALGDNNLSNGMRGSEVTELQQRLSMLGYEVGSTDGIFGPKTDSGVRLFQKEHGLTVDGIAGPNTINELKKLTGESLTSGGTSIGYKNTDVNLLARLVSAEARGEPYRGQIAVAAVVMNRIKSSSFPNNARDVIYQPSAFTRVNDGQINLSPTSSAINAVNEALTGTDPSYGALFFFNPSTSTSSWIWSRPQIIQIGEHIFAR